MTSPSVHLLRDGRQRRWAVAGAAVAVASVALAQSGYRAQDLVLVPLAVAAFVAKAALRSVPALVPAIAGLGFPLVANITGTEVESAMFLAVLGAALLASEERNRTTVAVYLVAALVAVFVLSVVGVFDWNWPSWIMGLLLGWLFGSMVFHYGVVIDQLEAAQVRVTDQAVLLERRRIARDVHDLVGHSLSVVMLHVTGARRLVRSDPDEAEAALVQAETAGRESLAEIRRTIALMRDAGDGETAAPAPDLTDIAAIVERYRNAGMTVRLEVEGPIERVDGARAVACYRIAQEALANVAKHTVGATVDVTVEVTAEACRVRIVDRDGRTSGGERGGRADGHGLTGMRERALSAGGSLLAGPLDGGWSVDAVFPLDRSDARW